MGKPKPCAQSITIPGYGTLPCNCEDSHPTRHIGLHWCVRDGGRNIMSYALTYLRMRHEKGYTDEKYAAAQLTVVICWGAWVGSVWVSPQAVDLPNTWYFMLIRGLRTVRTGYAHQPPARCAYLRRRAACPRASLSCVRRARWHARDRYRGGPGRRRAPVPRPIIVPAALVRGRMAHVCESAISASAKPTYTEA